MATAKTSKAENNGMEKELDLSADLQQALEKDITALSKYGGFDLLETTIEGTQNLNPEKKARKKIFLTETAKAEDREMLKKRLKLFASIISGSSDISSAIEKCQQQSEEASKLFNKNLKVAVEETRELEQSYRAVALFFKNTEQDKLKNITVMNSEMDQLKDLDNTIFIDAVTNELDKNYDRLDLRDNYSLLVIPGYLGSNKVVEKWSKIAYKNKVLLVTDFEHLDAPDDVIELFEAANLTGGDAFRSNVIMACNWVVGRGKIKDVGEEDDLFVPPSSALAGKIYTTLMSQVTAGKKFGSLNEVDGVKFPLKKSEIASLEKIGLVPMVNEYGKIMAFSAKTLFNGDNLGLQTYSVVRVFDWVTKVLMDFLNRRAFENFNANTQMDIQRQIVKFLDKIAGPGKLIEKFKIMRFEQDPNQKDRVFLDIHMVPYFPAKNFLIKLDGTRGNNPDMAEWKSQYDMSGK
jgi:Type VI secretion system, TssC, VipB